MNQLNDYLVKRFGMGAVGTVIAYVVAVLITVATFSIVNAQLGFEETVIWILALISVEHLFD